MKEWIAYKKPEFIREIVKDLKKRETEAEKILWSYLRNKKLWGYKFYRQKAVYAYTEEKQIHRFFIADFYNHETKLIIEIDGSIHDNQDVKDYDQMREYLLKNRWYTIIRFSNNEVINNISLVISNIHQIIKAPSNLEGVGGVINNTP